MARLPPVLHAVDAASPEMDDAFRSLRGSGLRRLMNPRGRKVDIADIER